MFSFKILLVLYWYKIAGIEFRNFRDFFFFFFFSKNGEKKSKISRNFLLSLVLKTNKNTREKNH